MPLLSLITIAKKCSSQIVYAIPGKCSIVQPADCALVDYQLRRKNWYEGLALYEMVRGSGPLRKGANM